MKRWEILIREDVTEIVQIVRLITATDTAGGIMGTIMWKAVSLAATDAAEAWIELVLKQSTQSWSGE